MILAPKRQIDIIEFFHKTMEEIYRKRKVEGAENLGVLTYFELRQVINISNIINCADQINEFFMDCINKWLIKNINFTEQDIKEFWGGFLFLHHS